MEQATNGLHISFRSKATPTFRVRSCRQLSDHGLKEGAHFIVPCRQLLAWYVDDSDSRRSGRRSRCIHPSRQTCLPLRHFLRRYYRQSSLYLCCREVLDLQFVRRISRGDGALDEFLDFLICFRDELSSARSGTACPPKRPGSDLHIGKQAGNHPRRLCFSSTLHRSISPIARRTDGE